METPAVRIVEVGPRDGLQAVEEIVPTELKIQLIQRLSKTGLRCIEATSFVPWRWIPQLADHRAVMQAIKEIQDAASTQIRYSVLVPNLRGFLAAAEAGAREVGVFVSATERFSHSNSNCSVKEGLARAKEIVKKAGNMGIHVRGYISCVFSCPFEGPTDPQDVLTVAQELLNMGCYEVSLGDTTGTGTPAHVRRLLDVLLKSIPTSRLAGHFHDTYGQAVANAVTAYKLGLRTFDSSVGGLGGCPYSPGAKGNLATEDLVYTFQEMGIATGVDLHKLAEIGHWINEKLGKPNGSRAGAAIYSKHDAAPAKGTPKCQPAVWTMVKIDPEYELLRNVSTVKIVLNRPRNGNALTRTMLTHLTTLFETLSKDSSVFHIVLTGTGKYFCTGMDLSSGGATATGADVASKQDQFEGLYQLFEAIDRTPQTTIALINGPTFGGGTGLAFVCDIRLAQANATFTMTEVKLGLCPATISKFVVREWGIAIAREAMLTSRPVTAQELHRFGVVHAIAASPSLPLSGVVDESRQNLDQLLQQYCDKFLHRAAPQASARTKELVSAAWRYAGDERQDKVIKDVFEWMIAPSKEAQIGTDAFRAGKKEVDWYMEYQKGKLTKGNGRSLKPKL
ncbi:uncharacterized protein Z520_07198 [Fonsecaea multimorphosa CBS 102226]|uniref:hydroxymethylglutaryl-CoA lyase n=1 Tax=Fonsecaea multimorphosa CBS 102226 TaxID=1442371 RepID=A0A0D2K220_9EURO|nr:uncharacterized protein Z520_07198 [Fonsecaea multimorphosa CBS 102226]KIX97084.1 hypothetical protein Z520_07198 [Fonsecaea multimorphosa CBS 102226]OAL22860.1 hypothetical protein AYO22_06768 [Fonsecaea multimorphosa]